MKYKINDIIVCMTFNLKTESHRTANTLFRIWIQRLREDIRIFAEISKLSKFHNICFKSFTNIMKRRNQILRCTRFFIMLG